MSAAYNNLQCDNFVATEKASFGSTEIANDLLVKGNLTVKEVFYFTITIPRLEML